MAAREDNLAARLRDLAAGCDACPGPLGPGRARRPRGGGPGGPAASPLTFWYPVWTWHWARPGDPRVPWEHAVRVSLRPAVAARKRAAICCFASQLEPRGPGAGPVLTPATVAHFTRDHEVLFRAAAR